MAETVVLTGAGGHLNARAVICLAAQARHLEAEELDSLSEIPVWDPESRPDKVGGR